jgi:putative membrane protein
MKKAMLAGMVVLSLAAPRLLATSPDEMFVLDVASDGTAEVELGNLASEKATSDDVKKFAQRMVTDHGKANDDLKTLAQSKNILLPATVDAKAKATHDRLAKLSGQAFERAYVQDMVAGHRKAIAAFKKESTSGKDPEVKAWATKTMPTIEEHLKMAQDIAKNVGAVGTSGKKK